jgi:hypothetical protein
MIIYLTVVGLLLVAIGLGGFVLSFGTFERIVCAGTVVVGILLCVGASRVSNKQKSEKETATH